MIVEYLSGFCAFRCDCWYVDLCNTCCGGGVCDYWCNVSCNSIAKRAAVCSYTTQCCVHRICCTLDYSPPLAPSIV